MSDPQKMVKLLIFNALKNILIQMIQHDQHILDQNKIFNEGQQF